MYEGYALNSRTLALIALFAFFLAVVSILLAQPSKHARGFYHVRPLAWWGREENIYILLWNAEEVEARVQISGDINCSVSIPAESLARVVCRVPRAVPGEYRIVHACLASEKTSECGELTLVFD